MVLLDRATTTPSVPPTASSWVLTAGGGPSDAAFQAGAALASLDTLARAQVIRRSRSHVTNTLKLLKLPDVVHDMLVSGTLSAGHARTLVTAYDPAEVARHIVENGLSVGQAEALA